MKRLALCASTLALAAAAPARAEVKVSPYVELQQLLYADLSDGGDTVTYTSVAAGIDAQVQTRSAQAQLDYRYDRYFGWGHDAQDQQVHSGLARASVIAVPDLVTVDGAAIATRARTSLRGPSPEFFIGDTSNTSQVYALEAGPTIARSIGDLDVSAGYHFGYVDVDTGAGSLDLGPGQPVLEDYSSSTSHNLGASIGMKSGVLPFGWTVSGGWLRENIHQMGARYTAKYVRGDVTVPLSYDLALVGGVGYEDIHESEEQLLVDANGNAVLTSKRHLQGDPTKPRLTVYDTDGLIWDAGVLWRPDRRTSLEARYGHRYGADYWYGSFSHQLSPTATFQAGVYNQLETYGFGLTSAVAALPTSFANPNTPFVGSFDGCVFGTGAGGGCLDNALQSVNDNLFRAKGAWALYSGGRGPWTYGLGASYAERDYISPVFGNGLISFAGVHDKSLTGQATIGRQLSPVSSVSGDLYATWYDSGLPGTPSVTTYGASGFYTRSFSPHLQGQAGAGVYASDVQDTNDDVVGSLLLGLRYQF